METTPQTTCTIQWDTKYFVTRSLIIQVSDRRQLVAYNSVSRTPHTLSSQVVIILLSFVEGATPREAFRWLKEEEFEISTDAFEDIVGRMARLDYLTAVQESDGQSEEFSLAPAGRGTGDAPRPSSAGAQPKQAPPPPPARTQQYPTSPTQGKARFLPPGADNVSRLRKNAFANGFEDNFAVPPRLRNLPMPLVHAVNDFHFAMMSDSPRNEFYYQLLQKHVTPETGVLEIGAGSGLLSLMAAKLGAKWVVAVEGSDDMAELARRNVAANGFSDKVKVLSMLSTDLERKHLPAQPDILVSEIFGTLLLSESAHVYIHDVRARGILKPSTRILPKHGVQYAVPIECAVLDLICSVSSWKGLDLRNMTALKDTCSCVFTKKYGFRMSSVPFKPLTASIPIVTVDFATTDPDSLPRNQVRHTKVVHSGTAHAMMLYWEVTDEGLEMSTDPARTVDNLPRDMAWGQALQLLDAGTDALPAPLKLTEGAELSVDCRASSDDLLLQFIVSQLDDKNKADAKDSAAPAVVE